MNMRHGGSMRQVVYCLHVMITVMLQFVGAFESQIIIPAERVGNGVVDSSAAVGLTEDDILEKKIMLTSSRGAMRTASTGVIGNWNNGRIPYSMDKVISDNAEKVLAIRKAFNLFESHTCIRFFPRTTEADYVRFFDGGPAKCSSYVGKIGGAQELSVGDGCERMVGVLVHEMVHAIGFPHEQARWDRDRFVSIQWDAIKQDKKQNFLSVGRNVYASDGIPYDYDSIMHYHQAAFSKDGRPTIITINRQAQNAIGQREGLSACDLAKINKRYNCPVMKDAPVCANQTIGGSVPAGCVDRDPRCPLAKVDASYCDSYPGIYKRLCDQTCNGCDGPQCVDSTINRMHCDEIKKDLKKCELDVMARIVCPKTCGVCV